MNVVAGWAGYKGAGCPGASGRGVATPCSMRQSNDVKNRGGEGKDLMKRTLYLPTLIATVVAVACAVALLAIS